MNDELTDADLDQIAAWADGERPRVLAVKVGALVAALRARRAQDTPSDPAAPGHPLTKADLDNAARVAALHPVSAGVHAEVTSFAFLRRLVSEVVYHRDEEARAEGYLRAPGAVAAAPTEDVREQAARAVHRALFSDQVPECQWDTTTGPRTKAECLRAADAVLALAATQFVPPVPSAGEDEATVERRWVQVGPDEVVVKAERRYLLCRHPAWPDPLDIWPATEENARRVWEEHPHPDAYVLAYYKQRSDAREVFIPARAAVEAARPTPTPEETHRG